MIDNREGITAGWAFFQRHASHIAGFGAIARPACNSVRRFRSQRFAPCCQVALGNAPLREVGNEGTDAARERAEVRGGLPIRQLQKVEDCVCERPPFISAFSFQHFRFGRMPERLRASLPPYRRCYANGVSERNLNLNFTSAISLDTPCKSCLSFLCNPLRGRSLGCYQLLIPADSHCLYKREREAHNRSLEREYDRGAVCVACGIWRLSLRDHSDD
jgi:hypothetical protein